MGQLKGSQLASAPGKRGTLTIFFGMAPGVGKTYAMLQSAREEKLIGRDVVIGFAETHEAKASNRLIEGFSRIPFQRVHGAIVGELDFDALIARRPHVVIMDELARSNAEGSRHSKRYQDVLELLEAGIDVYTTLNLQEVGSMADAVQRITNLRIRETVPDSVLDGAEFRLVDLSPAKLLKRLREQMSYLSQDVELGECKFFSESNLMALREIAWRTVTERMGREAQEHLQHQETSGSWKAGQRLLAVVDANEGAERVVREAGRLARASSSPWIALYVETPQRLNDAQHERITRVLALAEELRAEVVTTTDSDPVRGLLRFASQRHATQIVVGGSSRTRWPFFRGDSFLRRLSRERAHFDIHVVSGGNERLNSFNPWQISNAAPWSQYLIAVSVIMTITWAVAISEPLIGGPHAAALIYLLAVVLLSSFVRRGPMLLAATMSALLWDYFILSPVYEFRINHVEDALFFGMYFIIALTLGQLTTRNREQQNLERLREERATTLYLLSQELNAVTGLDDILKRAVVQMERAFQGQIAVLLRGFPEHLLSETPHPSSTLELNDEDRRAAAWTFVHGQRAGKFTANVPQSNAIFVPLTTGEGRTGVIGLRLSQSSAPTIQQLNLIDAFSQQVAFAIDRQHLRDVSERTKLLAESERLSKTLLNSMSHEMRTPIAVIKSAVSNMAQLKYSGMPEPQSAIISAIQDASERLNRLMGNVLDIARLESGHVKARLTECDVSDLIHVALAEVEKELASHPVTVNIAPNLPIVPMDFVLMEQALINLLSNTAAHTNPGTPVTVSARSINDFLVIDVEDRGAGIRPESLERIFEKFYREPNAPTGGTGLGLSIVKGFVEAQGGRVEAKNRRTGGTIFTIRLPLGNIATVSSEANV